jgi:hypothetical protein
MYYIVAFIVFISDGYEQNDSLLHTVNFYTKKDCETYLNIYDSQLRLNITKMFNSNKIELKNIEDMLCVHENEILSFDKI